MGNNQSKPAIPKPPRHLSPESKTWFAEVSQDFDLEPHQVRLLTLAAEAWDRCQQARRAIEEHGLVYLDRFGFPKARPEVGTERDSRISFARLVRELGMDVADPAEARVQRIKNNRRRGG